MNEISENNLISVIMGVYNCAETLPSAIESIHAQTYPEWELIICDDASDDGTYEVAKAYEAKYAPRIKVIRNEENRTLAYSLNQCLKLAKGYYVARMDGDDISKADRFEKQIDYLKKHPDIQLVGTAMQQFDDDGWLIRTISKPIHPDKWTMKKENPFNHATILTYMAVYKALGGYSVSPQTVRGEDRELWYRFFYEGYTGYNLSDAFYYVRENEQAIKRRTFKSRWNVFKINSAGYRLLNYPRMWILRPFFDTLVKSLTPHFVQRVYRKVQKKLLGHGQKIR